MNIQDKSEIFEFEIKDKKVILDAEDAHLVIGKKWHLANGYARTSSIAQNSDGRERKYYYLHLLIMQSKEVHSPNCNVIFENGNRLDCRRDNLKIGTFSKKYTKKGLRSDNSSGYKGVRKSNTPNKWIAMIKFEGKDRYLGSFSTPQEAATAYNNEALKIHGEGIWLNPV